MSCVTEGICKSVPALNTGMALGHQVTVEYYDCNPRILADTGKLEEVFVAAARESGATVISSHFHAFVPQGTSGVVIISESHFAVHAWPEHDYAAVDIFTCGETIDFDAAVRAIRDGLESANPIISSMMNRGIVNNLGIERFVTVCENSAARYSLSWRDRFEQTNARAISCAIDLYDCGADNGLPDCAGCDFGRRFAEMFDTKITGSCRNTKLEGGDISFRIDLEEGFINGLIDPEAKAVSLDIFFTRYFDPRQAAESALATFLGRHYRMQIAIRQ